MNRINMTKVIEEEIDECLNRGVKTKQEIITQVCGKFGVKRPTVRRAKAGLVAKLQAKIKVLEG